MPPLTNIETQTLENIAKVYGFDIDHLRLFFYIFAKQVNLSIYIFQRDFVHCKQTKFQFRNYVRRGLYLLEPNMTKFQSLFFVPDTSRLAPAREQEYFFFFEWRSLDNLAPLDTTFDFEKTLTKLAVLYPELSELQPFPKIINIEPESELKIFSQKYFDLTKITNDAEFDFCDYLADSFYTSWYPHLLWGILFRIKKCGDFVDFQRQIVDFLDLSYARGSDQYHTTPDQFFKFYVNHFLFLENPSFDIHAVTTTLKIYLKTDIPEYPNFAELLTSFELLKIEIVQPKTSQLETTKETYPELEELIECVLKDCV